MELLRGGSQREVFRPLRALSSKGIKVALMGPWLDLKASRLTLASFVSFQSCSVISPSHMPSHYDVIAHVMQPQGTS